MTKLPIKKLIVREFVANEDDVTRLTFKVEQDEWRYTYFEDPITKKLYRPVEGFIIEGEELNSRFIEV